MSEFLAWLLAPVSSFGNAFYNLVTGDGSTADATSFFGTIFEWFAMDLVPGIIVVMINTSWLLMSSMLESIDIFAQLPDAFISGDPIIISMLEWFGFFEALGIIIAAFVTRKILNFIPFA